MGPGLQCRVMWWLLLEQGWLHPHTQPVAYNRLLSTRAHSLTGGMARKLCWAPCAPPPLLSGTESCMDLLQLCGGQMADWWEALTFGDKGRGRGSLGFLSSGAHRGYGTG